jgi:predicted small secreted protein
VIRITVSFLVASMLLAGCDTSRGLAKADVTRGGTKRCAYDTEFRKAVVDAGFSGKVGDYPAGFDQVIVHVGDQDYADSADSTDLADVRGASSICRYSIDGRYLFEGYLYYFGPRADRARLKDASAWDYAHDEVDDVPGRRTAVVKLRARGAGASAALAITLVGYQPDADAHPRELRTRELDGPLPSAARVDALAASIARRLDARR